jgi:hypothetical protein
VSAKEGKMSVRVERIREENTDECRHFIKNCPQALVQQTWEWGQVICGIGQDLPVFFLARDENGRPIGAMPAYMFECEPGSLMISVPQAGGYGGVVVGNLSRKEEYAALLDAFITEAERQNCALATISTQPFFGDYELYGRHFAPDFERDNFYQFLDLKADILADASSKQRGNIRRSIQKAQKHGLRVTFEDTDDRFEKWYAVQCRRMMELGAEPLPKKLFESARLWLFPEDMGFFAYVLDGPEVIGGALFVGLNEVLDVFLMSCDSDHMKKQPNNIMVLKAIEYARDKGFKYLNWQSCGSRESGVYKFKQSWGSREGRHCYISKITGDISQLESMPLEEIKERYRWHYVMPYERLRTYQLGGI